MSLRSQESRANAKALISGLVVPALLMTSFIISARTTLTPAPASATAKESSVAPIPAVVSRSLPRPVAIYPAGSSYGHSEDQDREFFWALVEGTGNGKHQTVGSTDERARRMISRSLRRESGKFLYLRIDGRDYIVRDPELIAAAGEIVEPIEALGRKMGELGGRQGALGGRQGALGGEQGMLGAQQAELAARQASLSFRINSRERRGLSTTSLKREQGEIDEAMRECSERQSELGRRQSELGAQQSKLGAVQSRYGEEMNRLSAEIEKKLRKLADQSIESGQAVELTDDEA